MSLSTRAANAVESFASSLGLPARPAADGSYSFVFERSGTLTITASHQGARTLLSLARIPARLDAQVERRLLGLAGPDQTTQRSLSAGLGRDGSVILVVAIEDEEIDLPTIEVGLQQLLAAQSVIG